MIGDNDQVTPINLAGYGVAFLGVAYYNPLKLQAIKKNEDEKKAREADEEGWKLLEEKSEEVGPKKNEAED